MPSIKTRRLILRDLTQDDFNAIRQYASDRVVTRYLRSGEPSTPNQTKEFLKNSIEEQKVKLRITYNLGIILKKENKLIGTCRISIKNAEHKRGDIGYILKRE
jgi:[ribosomal protein S5]-alanine N-acetyltransferase